MSEPLQQFGGSWTNQKLERLRKYLVAYHDALKNQPFRLEYTDAFAGTGYNTPKSAPDERSPLFNDLAAPKRASSWMDQPVSLYRFHDPLTAMFSVSAVWNVSRSFQN